MSPARPALAPSSLAGLPVGARLRVTEVAANYLGELSREGLLPGAVVEVASRTPLGGPVIVAVGRARLALSAPVAAAVHGELVP